MIGLQEVSSSAPCRIRFEELKPCSLGGLPRSRNVWLEASVHAAGLACPGGFQMPLSSLSHPAPLGDRQPAELTVAVDLIAGRITLAGGLDRRNAHHLLDAVRALTTVTHARWVVDAARVNSCDASGLRVISACYRQALRQGSDMRIVGAAPWLRRALAALRLDTHIVGGDSHGTEKDPVADKAYPLVKVKGLPLVDECHFERAPSPQ